MTEPHRSLPGPAFPGRLAPWLRAYTVWIVATVGTYFFLLLIILGWATDETLGIVARVGVVPMVVTACVAAWKPRLHQWAWMFGIYFVLLVGTIVVLFVTYGG